MRRAGQALFTAPPPPSSTRIWAPLPKKCPQRTMPDLVLTASFYTLVVSISASHNISNVPILRISLMLRRRVLCNLSKPYFLYFSIRTGTISCAFDWQDVFSYQSVFVFSLACFICVLLSNLSRSFLPSIRMEQRGCVVFHTDGIRTHAHSFAMLNPFGVMGDRILTVGITRDHLLEVGGWTRAVRWSGVGLGWVGCGTGLLTEVG